MQMILFSYPSAFDSSQILIRIFNLIKISESLTIFYIKLIATMIDSTVLAQKIQYLISYLSGII